MAPEKCPGLGAPQRQYASTARGRQQRSGLFIRQPLRVQAAYFARLEHARACQDKRGGAHRYFLLLRHLPYRVERFAHDAGQAAVDLFVGPEEAREVLCPLEVADGDAAGVGQHVWHDQDATLGQDIVGSWQGRAVGAFQDDLGADFCARSAVICCSSAAGIRMSLSMPQKSSRGRNASAPGKPSTLPASATWAS